MIKTVKVAVKLAGLVAIVVCIIAIAKCCTQKPRS